MYELLLAAMMMVESNGGVELAGDRETSMKVDRCGFLRRRFLGAAATTAAAAACGWLTRASAEELKEPRKRKMLLSFYCDDTSPTIAGAKAFQTFLDYCAEQGIAGESTALLASGGRSICRSPGEEGQAFLKQVARAWQCGIDTHVELMTHHGLFDFDSGREPDGAVHEGVWLYDPAVTAEQYERYIGGIIAEGDRAGIKFTGLTWPGCGCEACNRRYAELRAAGHTEPNPALWKALLGLAKQGKFRGRAVPCFFGSSETDFGIHQKASDGDRGVYDLMPNATDQFGIWENDPKRVNPDYYIAADGKSGIIIRHLQAGDPYCIWYAHWQGLNPGKGVGWRAFTTVVERVRTHLAGRVAWMRPADIAARYHKAGGWGFLDAL